MEKKVIVISLGGSIIVPDEINVALLSKFKQVLDKHRKNYKFVVVCGGGSIARKYIAALRKKQIPEKLLCLVGIAVTRVNARFMTYFFGNDAKQGIPHDMKHVESLLKSHNVIFCGSLRYEQNNTSDGTAAKLASYFKTEFINMTNVPGLYTKNPLTHKDAVFIPKTTWQKIYERTKRMKYHAGQHFVLDQHAAEVIRRYKVKTYIIGKNLKQLDNLLSCRKFKGTVIEG